MPSPSSTATLPPDASATRGGILGPVAEAVHDAVFFTRFDDRRVLDVNQAALRLFGYARDELIGQPTLVVHVDRAHYDRFAEIARPAVTRGESVLFEFDLRRKDGTVFPAHITVSPLPPTPDGGLPIVGIIRDLTHARRAERERAEAEARWRSVVEHAHDWIYLADEEGRIHFANRGRGASTAKGVVGRTLYEWVSREEAARVRPIYEGVFRTGKPATFTATGRVEGRMEHYECRVAPVLQDGRVVAASVTSIDITHRVQMEQELRRTTENLKDFVETSAIGLHWVGGDGTILWANRADHAFLGYEAEEYVGRNIREFHADANVIEDILARLSRDERLLEYPARLKAKDGSIRHVLIDSSVRWENGEFAHTRCFTRNVTLQRELEERYRNLVAHAPDQIVTIDAHGRITDLNRAPDGGPVEKVLGASVFDAVVDEDRERVRAVIADVLATRRPADYEARIRMPSGERWLHVRAAPLTLRGEPGAVLISTDVTQRKATEAEIDLMRGQLVQGEKLSALGSLVSGVAHELRTPLTFLSNNAFLLKRKLEEASRRGASAAEATREVARFLEDITAGVDRLNQLVEDLRRYTRARHEVEMTAGPVGEMIVDAIDLFRATSRHSHVLETRLDRTSSVQANRGALQQLTLNLLQNAAEATPPGGRIRVSTRDEGDAVVLEVADEGGGIPPSVQARMFEPLFTTKPTGTGLGLSIVKRIVDEHNAAITCQSGEGGTTFRVAFPVARP